MLIFKCFRHTFSLVKKKFSLKNRRFFSNQVDLNNKLLNILNAARTHSTIDRFENGTPLYLLKLESIALINEVNKFKPVEKNIKSSLAKTALALLHCYANNGHLDLNFSRVLLDNIYLRGCSPRAALTILESLHKSGIIIELLVDIFNNFLGNQKTLVDLAAQDIAQLLWRYIAIHDIYPFHPSYKYYYSIGTLIMHSRKKIRYCLNPNNVDDRIAWSVVGGNRALEDFLMAINLFSYTLYSKKGVIIFNDNIIEKNLSNLFFRQLAAIDELLKIPIRQTFKSTTTSECCKKVSNCLKELLRYDHFKKLVGDKFDLLFESSVSGTRFSIDILILR